MRFHGGSSIDYIQGHEATEKKYYATIMAAALISMFIQNSDFVLVVWFLNLANINW